MISAKCEQCGLINDFANEICHRCGTELSESAKIFIPGKPDYEPQPVMPDEHDEQHQILVTSPSIGPFRGVGSVLSPAISIFTDNIWLITKIVLVVFAPLEIFKTVSLGNKATTWQASAGTVLLGLFCKALVAPSLIFALLTVMRTGVAPSLNESYRWGLSRLGKLIACATMAWFLEGLGYICLIIPGIILTVAFELIYPMAAIENRSPVEILKRSYHLTKGHRWSIFWANFLLALLATVVAAPVGAVTAMLMRSGAAYWPLLAALSMATDIVNESMTILSLVIYLSILNHAGARGATLQYNEV